MEVVFSGCQRDDCDIKQVGISRDRGLRRILAVGAGVMIARLGSDQIIDKWGNIERWRDEEDVTVDTTVMIATLIRGNLQLEGHVQSTQSCFKFLSFC